MLIAIRGRRAGLDVRVRHKDQLRATDPQTDEEDRALLGHPGELLGPDQLTVEGVQPIEIRGNDHRLDGGGVGNGGGGVG
ncbi:hypothetical protein OHU45_37825 [Streptomyces tubercidicus]|uniref:hypothetical protein n=1 Tax=Streptomyces tubercidicus TaxID=47759 RepID=UPI0037578D83